MAFVGYIVLELILIVTRKENWLQITLLACLLAVVIFLIIALFHAEDKVNNHIYKVLGIFVAIGYILTALASILTLPIFTCIGQRKMEMKMTTVPYSSAG